MKLPESTKPLLQGAAVGALAITILGFSTDTIVTSGTAGKIANDQSQAAVIEALTPICVAQFKAADDAQVQVAALHELSKWKRDDYVEERGWATMAGSEKPVRGVADACAEALIAAFPADA